MKKSTSLFRTADGNNYVVTFMLVCTLFLLWGLCNGMIDVLNKHFQNSLNVSKMQSALVQFANYMGYFLMAIPSGMLARRFGYKGGIMVGLVLIALGAFWFIPATRIGTYWAFLVGLFILATGLTCLETIANPYTTVLGPAESGAARINLAQSCNGVGWILGPMVCGFFVLSSTGEVNRSNDSLYKPYLAVGIVVTVLIVIFAFSKVPDIKAEEECSADCAASTKPVKSMWLRKHFVLAVAAQFFYVAAQTGIFSYFVNYIVSDTPVLKESMAKALPGNMVAPASLFSAGDIKDVSALVARMQNDPDPNTRPVSQFLWSQFTTNQSLLTAPSIESMPGLLPATRSIRLSASELDKEIMEQKKTVLLAVFNQVLQTNTLFNAQRFAGMSLSEEARQQIKLNPEAESLVRLNRRLLEETLPSEQIARSAYLKDAAYSITDSGASVLLSFGGFGLFLLGRFIGSMVLRVFKAHSTLALFCVANVVMMVLVMFPMGWFSVFGLFMSFFFMSIMFPTIFALGIRGLGEQTKKASSFIVMAIVGGAIMPLLMGWLADKWGMRVGFLMPLLCFILIAAYAAFWPALESKDSGHAVAE